MSGVKRWVVVALVVVLALSGLSVIAARAQDVKQAWLGVSVVDGDGGAEVRDVASGSPADDAGLRVGDVIKAVGDTQIETAQQLVDAIQSHAPGDEVVLAVEWRGESRQVSVTLAERPAETTPSQGTRPQIRGTLDFLGLSAEMTDEGLLIKSIDDSSPLKDSGLQAGDVITAIGGQPLDEFLPRGLMQALQSGDKPVVFTVLRDGKSQDIEVTIDWSALAGEVMPYVSGMGQPTQLGVQFKTLTPDIAEQEGLTVTEGALVEEVVDGTPAADAGLQKGDVITAVDGDAVDQEHTLPDRLYAYEEGDVVKLSVLRAGETLEVDVTLGPRAGMSFGPMMDGMGPMMGWYFSGPEGSGGRFLNQHPNLRDFFRMHPFMGQGNGSQSDSGSIEVPGQSSQAAPEPVPGNPA